MCGTVGTVDKEKTSLHVLNVPLTVSNLHDPDQISRGRPLLPKKWVLGDHFSNENFGPGDQNFQDQNSGDRTTGFLTLQALIQNTWSFTVPDFNNLIDEQ